MLKKVVFWFWIIRSLKFHSKETIELKLSTPKHCSKSMIVNIYIIKIVFAALTADMNKTKDNPGENKSV